MHPRAMNKSPGRNKSGLKKSEHPLGTLGGNCLNLCSEAQLPPPPPLWLPLLMMMGSHQSGDGSPEIRGKTSLQPLKIKQRLRDMSPPSTLL